MDQRAWGVIGAGSLALGASYELERSRGVEIDIRMEVEQTLIDGAEFLDVQAGKVDPTADSRIVPEGGEMPDCPKERTIGARGGFKVPARVDSEELAV